MFDLPFEKYPMSKERYAEILEKAQVEIGALRLKCVRLERENSALLERLNEYEGSEVEGLVEKIKDLEDRISEYSEAMHKINNCVILS